MICGKLCSGKTTYAHKLLESGGKALLSIDEIMLMMFGQHCGDMHEEYASRTEKFLLDKSLELLNAGIDVVFDWGFWKSEQRRRIKEFYRVRGIKCRLIYLRVDDAVWHARIEKRNGEVLLGEANAYYVDEKLARKFAGLFEMPDASEIDEFYPEN